MFGLRGTVTAPEISKYLKEAHGFQLAKLQDETTIESMSNPVGFITKRQEALEEVYKEGGAVVKTYEEALKLFTGASFGLPDKEAHELASEASEALRVATLKALEIRNPGGYARAMATGQAKHDSEVQYAKIADPGLTREADFRAHYKQKYQTKAQKSKAKKQELKAEIKRLQSK